MSIRAKFRSYTFSGVLAVSFIFSILSCGTMPAKSSSPQGASFSKEYAFLGEINLEPGEIYVVDRFHDGETYSANAFYASLIMSRFEGTLKFSEKLSPESLQSLTAALCKNIPITTDNKELRFIVVGKYHNKDSDLYIALDLVSLKEGAVPGKKYAIRYMTNAMNFTTTDKETGETIRPNSGMMMNGNINFVFGTIPFDNGDLIAFPNITIPEPQFYKTATSMELGNMMDTLIKDQYPENDAKALEAYNIIVSDNTATPVTKLLAELNYFLYLLKHGTVKEAEAQLQKLPGFLPENPHESLVKAVNVEAPYYLDRVKNYSAATFPAANKKSVAAE